MLILYYKYKSDKTLLCALIPMIPFAFGLWMSMTRILDYQKSYIDVVTGIALGMGSATLSFSIFNEEWFGRFKNLESPKYIIDDAESTANQIIGAI